MKNYAQLVNEISDEVLMEYTGVSELKNNPLFSDVYVFAKRRTAKGWWVAYKGNLIEYSASMDFITRQLKIEVLNIAAKREKSILTLIWGIKKFALIHNIKNIVTCVKADKDNEAKIDEYLYYGIIGFNMRISSQANFAKFLNSDANENLSLNKLFHTKEGLELMRSNCEEWRGEFCLKDGSLSNYYYQLALTRSGLATLLR